MQISKIKYQNDNVKFNPDFAIGFGIRRKIAGSFRQKNCLQTTVGMRAVIWTKILCAFSSRFVKPITKSGLKTRSKFVSVVCVFYFLILIFGFSSIIGCAGPQHPAVMPDSGGPTEYEVSFSTEAAWRAVMRFADKYDYRLINLDSDKGLMEITGGDTYASGYNAYGFHYTLIFIGLEKGTKIVIEGSFHNSDGKEVMLRYSLEKTKKENEQRLLAALKKYFETELNHGSAKTKLS